MGEIGVQLIFARSPQAKGRVERTAGTLQDRLVTELRLADFQIDVTGEQATVCPAGHPSIEEYELKDAPERVEVHFAGTNMRALFPCDQTVAQ